jgi:competence protein ComEA
MRLDINKATQAEIDAVDGLQGHGHEIVRYRKERGFFASLRQLDEVPGLAGKLDDATLEQLGVEAASTERAAQ